MAVQLRLATKADEMALYIVTAQAVSYTYHAPTLSNLRIDIERGNAYIIEKDGADVGLLIYKEEGDHVLFDEFVIRLGYRGGGIGTAAIQAMLDRLAGRRVELVTHPANPAAHLYARCGFITTEVIENFYGDGQPRMHMVREPR